MATTPEAALCNVALARIGQRDFITDLNTADDTSEMAELCSVIYPSVRDNVVSEFPWGFATRAAILAPATGTDDPGFAHAYSDPAGLLQPQFIYGGWRPGASLYPFEGWRSWMMMPRPHDIPLRHTNKHIYTDWSDDPADWDATVTYTTNSVVSYAGLFYRSIQVANINQIPPNVGAYWAAVTDSSSAVLVYTAQVTDVTLFPPLFTDYLRWALAQELALSQDALGRAEHLEPKIQLARAKALAAEVNGNTADPKPVSRYITARR